MLSCQQVEQALSAFVDGELDEAPCQQVEEHMAACPRCRGALAELRSTLQLCRGWSVGERPGPVSAGERARLQAALQQALGRSGER